MLKVQYLQWSARVFQRSPPLSRCAQVSKKVSLPFSPSSSPLTPNSCSPSSSLASTSRRLPPLLRLHNAIIPGLQAPSGSAREAESQPATLDLTMEDAAETEAWAITGPAAEKGGAVKAEVVKALLGLSRLYQRGQSAASEPTRHHPPFHPFLREGSHSALSPSQALRLVSFSSRLSSAYGSSSSNAFVDFSTRYGAIREEDRVTLYESLMAELGTQTGLPARMALMPDPLADPEEEARRDFQEGVTRLRWLSKEAEGEARDLARSNQERINRMAPLLDLSKGDPPLLERPLVALSNGQTRRARILAALCVGCEVLLLEEPFTGLDPPTRASLTTVLARLHAERSPRVICVLREQDELPRFVTHVLSIGEQGQILFNGALPTSPRPRTAAELSAHLFSGKGGDQRGGYELCLAQSAKGVGRGDVTQVPVVALDDVSIAYKGKTILHRVSLRLAPGSRTILVGDNGSGKTTLLSLLLGSHPQSYSLPAERLSLFGRSRSHAANATPLLKRKCGELSPELVNAFPRRSLEMGGLTVEDAIGSGFEGVFTKRRLNARQKERVKSLVTVFQPVLTPTRLLAQGMQSEEVQAEATDGGEAAEARLASLLSSPLHSLTPGSQVLVLLLRSIVHRPSLLILDEPFQGMSARQVSAVRDWIDGVHLERMDPEDRAWFRSVAIVLVSHFEEEWPRSAGQLLRLREGVVVESF